MRLHPASPGIVRCPKCSLGVPGETWSGPALHTCPSCRSSLYVQLFPALYERPPESAGEVAVPGDAACFFHAQKKAVRACDRCGRFLCALCDLPVGTRHVCPACLESGLEKRERLPELVTARLCWGRLALAVAVFPLLLTLVMLFPLWIATAPTAIFCAIYGWNRPASLVHGKQRVSAILAVLIALAEIGGLVMVGVLVWKGATHG